MNKQASRERAKAFKVNQHIVYQGQVYVIVRIDGHVHPICLGGGLRVDPEEIRALEEDV